MRVAVIFDNFGPYHLARLSAASRHGELLAIEVAARSGAYAWLPTRGPVPFERRVLIEEGTSEGAKRRCLAARLRTVLDELQPEAVAIPGWSSRAAFLALNWCLGHRVPAVLMSESQAIDEVRRPLKEWVKRRYLNGCSAALVGGGSHRDYLVQLGMPADRVFLGYNAVDNDFFSHSAQAARAAAEETRGRLNLPPRFFLASNRFIPKKNLFLLLRSFARYRKASPDPAWDLVLLGDGPLRPEILASIQGLGLQGHVHLPGFQQYHQLPLYYALAGAFVHASTTEQWGLVVNEAMASGLPVLVSERCGSARELVRDGQNGYRFDPDDEQGLACRMGELARNQPLRTAMGRASQERIRDWGPERFGQGLAAAAQCARDAAPPSRRRAKQFLVQLLAWH